MIDFILNDQDISTDLPAGMTVLDFVRYRQNLTGTKIGCREGDCGACTVLVGELLGEEVKYRTMTSCLMPLANAAGKHIVSIEGINPADRGLTPVQQAMVDESGTQCGFCTVGFVMSLTGFCVDGTEKTREMAVSAIDGNICRCTGYKSIERAGSVVCGPLSVVSDQNSSAEKLDHAIESKIVPGYFSGIRGRLAAIKDRNNRPLTTDNRPLQFVGGGTDVYVQKHDSMTEAEASHLLYAEQLRGVRDTGEYIEIGASATVTDLLESPIMNEIFPDLFRHLKLVSSTPIRNMATLAGNFVNASPIGDMTVWFLALDAEIQLSSPPYKGGVAAPAVKGADGLVLSRVMKLKDLYLGYKQLARTDDEYISTIRFHKPTADFCFNFEKVCKRTYLDIATVNTAISLTVTSAIAEGWVPPALSGSDAPTGPIATHTIQEAHVAAGGVSPVPLYLRKTSEYLVGRTVNEETIAAANEIMQSEILPISDVRGTEAYKRLLLRQLFRAHFVELFPQEKV